MAVGKDVKTWMFYTQVLIGRQGGQEFQPIGWDQEGPRGRCDRRKPDITSGAKQARVQLEASGKFGHDPEGAR